MRESIIISMAIGAATLSSIVSVAWNDLTLPARPAGSHRPAALSVDEVGHEIQNIIKEDRDHKAACFARPQKINTAIGELERRAAVSLAESVSAQERAALLNTESENLRIEIEEAQRKTATEREAIRALNTLIAKHEKAVAELKKQNASLARRVQSVSADLNDLKKDLASINSSTTIVSEMRNIVQARKEAYVADAQARSNRRRSSSSSSRRDGPR